MDNFRLIFSCILGHVVLLFEIIDSRLVVHAMVDIQMANLLVKPNRAFNIALEVVELFETTIMTTFRHFGEPGSLPRNRTMNHV